MMERLRKEFEFLQGQGALAVLLFGSAAKNEKGPRDTDICIVAPAQESRRIMNEVYLRMDVGAKKYDVYCFEELPLYLRWEIMKNHTVVWAKNEGDLAEYFRYFWKLYEDQKHRMEITPKEILQMLHASRYYR